ncbi:MAG: flagellar hook-associated protein FlgK, partial [Pseudomonadota bacterium]
SVAGLERGVRIEGVVRHSDTGLLADRRGAETSFSEASTRSSAFARLESVLGTPDEATSLSSRFSQFEAALVSAAAAPESNARLEEVRRTADALVSTLRETTDGIQEERLRADRAIASQVDTLNSNLEQIQKLNGSIGNQGALGRDVSGLMDQRQELIDEIAAIVPVRVSQRPHGQLALYTPGGVALLDTSAATIDFTPSNQIVPEMTLASGGLSSLTVNGRAVDLEDLVGPTRGSALSANLSMRDAHAPEVQAQIDGIARDLIERFEPLGDPVTGLGLFVDGAAPFDPANEAAVSSRIAINPVVDPDQGGATYRIRDGLDATVTGSVGDNTRLTALHTALVELRPTGSSAFPTTSFSASALVTEALSGVGTARQAAERDSAHFGARFETLKAAELRNGVDSDYEMQQLLLVEAAYAANARVIQTVDEMIDRLMRL